MVLIGAVSKTSFTLRPPLVFCGRQASRRRSVSAINTLTESDCFVGDAHGRQASTPPSTSPSDGIDGLRGPLWKTMSSKELGIKKSMIARQTKLVLNELKKKGHEVYLVGGCVRDLIMKRVPKDFDIITTANLSEVKKAFLRCEIVGKRFPICLVHVKDSIVEVSSFSTSGRYMSSYVRHISNRPLNCDEHDYMRWRNCLGRDFTINGLMFDPYSHIVFDYMGGMEDIKKAKVRTVIPALTSFREDCARILRAIRIAARLGFSFTRETAQCMKDLATSVLRLDKGRILMEMNYMFAYGSAEPSMRLLWKFGLLDLLLPIQAAYLVSQGFRRCDMRTNMLLVLLSNMDRLLAPDRPCHSSLWVAILAFHQATARVPRDPLVVATFSLAVHNGGDMVEAIGIARRMRNPHNQHFLELLEPHVWPVDADLVNEVGKLSSSVIAALMSMTDDYFVSQAMARYTQAPYSDLVFIPLNVYLSVCKIFNCIEKRVREERFVPKQDRKINYSSLAHGDLAEVRHVFARIVFDAVFPPNLEEQDEENPPRPANKDLNDREGHDPTS
ncbi:tRNA nucleotidyltransferase (CCA-adding enzyme) [Apostasia shenzhenica]|uniref:tRNA nucleotidyltransferase (CCA-adding enzyme) n=1 Tax=Apostasia shenzhenica TaxID=1088818 RepID=A0A2I0AN49_9ASPA|nr:tRNA nucleotidyltransferase (CCA-adding enzyme) [Apostasia shenzhenica]